MNKEEFLNLLETKYWLFSKDCINSKLVLAKDHKITHKILIDLTSFLREDSPVKERYSCLKNNTFYNEDALQFTPNENYDTIFSCPPYFTDELYKHYNYKGSELTHWIKSFWEPAIKSFDKPSLKTIGVIMGTRYSEEIIKSLGLQDFKLKKREPIGTPTKNYIHNTKIKCKEELLIFKRRNII